MPVGQLVCVRAVLCNFLAVNGSSGCRGWCDGIGQDGRERVEVSRRGEQEPGGLTRTGEQLAPS